MFPIFFSVTCPVALKVRRGLDVLRHQHEHRWIWFEYVPHPVHLRCHWSSCQAHGLLPPPGHRSENLPSRNAAGHRKLHCHQHLSFQRLKTSYIFFIAFDLFTVNLCVSRRSLAAAFCRCHHWKRLLRGRLHHRVPLHRRAFPHSHSVSRCRTSLREASSRCLKPAEWFQTHNLLCLTFKVYSVHLSPSTNCPLFCLWGSTGARKYGPVTFSHILRSSQAKRAGLQQLHESSGSLHGAAGLDAGGLLDSSSSDHYLLCRHHLWLFVSAASRDTERKPAGVNRGHWKAEVCRFVHVNVSETTVNISLFRGMRENIILCFCSFHFRGGSSSSNPGDSSFVLLDLKKKTVASSEESCHS